MPMDLTYPSLLLETFPGSSLVANRVSRATGTRVCVAQDDAFWHVACEDHGHVVGPYEKQSKAFAVASHPEKFCPDCPAAAAARAAAKQAPKPKAAPKAPAPKDQTPEERDALLAQARDAAAAKRAAEVQAAADQARKELDAMAGRIDQARQALDKASAEEARVFAKLDRAKRGSQRAVELTAEWNAACRKVDQATATLMSYTARERVLTAQIGEAA